VKTNIATYKYWGFSVLLTSDGWFSQQWVCTAPSCLMKERSECGLMPVADCRSSRVIDNSLRMSLMDYSQKITRGIIVFVSQEILLICLEVIGVIPCIWLCSPTVIQRYNIVALISICNTTTWWIQRKEWRTGYSKGVPWLAGTISYIVHPVEGMSYSMHKGCAEASCLPAKWVANLLSSRVSWR
jgi:hypothetical protein